MSEKPRKPDMRQYVPISAYKTISLGGHLSKPEVCYTYGQRYQLDCTYQTFFRRKGLLVIIVSISSDQLFECGEDI